MSYQTPVGTSPLKATVAHDANQEPDHAPHRQATDQINPQDEQEKHTDNVALSDDKLSSPFDGTEYQEDSEQNTAKQNNKNPTNQTANTTVESHASVPCHGDLSASQARAIYTWLENQNNPVPDGTYHSVEEHSLVGFSEEELRHRAVDWMEFTHSDKPNGIVVVPPTWYSYSRFGPNRPRAWIKDFTTGRVRPRRMTNDLLVSLSLAERERKLNRERRDRGEPAE
ncbi:hypothetical protein B0H65DRAFT_589446 [Neurospora tetraspora]|uniref:Uncharacterized protein n=1 Tax=Neurospora tetraspora TaxID=94610 RepID=A0AAE0JCP2_9PEZI|nr:hypothetical protein B0H65DRAFT_589446 [Neurospora tetraspora]